MINVLRRRNFRLLWVGEGISLLGDQFFLIALPWLVLQMTGDALAVGGVLAVAGIPRALFMLIGGALTDRFSPRNVMLSSNLIRMVLVILLTTLVLMSVARLWVLYVLAFVFGVVDAFFYPVQIAIIPQVTAKEHLQVGNSIIQGTAQLSRFAGPVLAGAMIALFGNSSVSTAAGAESIPDLQGIGFAFGFDAFTFLASTVTLWMIRTQQPQDVTDKTEPSESVWSSIRAGLVRVWNDPGLRVLFFAIAAVNVLVNGPLIVGIPVLAEMRFAEGAAAFGIIMSSYGGGNFLGTILAGALPRPTAKYTGPLWLIVTSVLGAGVATLGLTSSLTLASLICLAVGTGNGYIVISFITWLQRRTPQNMLGRVMSLLMFAAMGLNPISMALAGVFIGLNAMATFVGAGVLMTAIIFLAALNQGVREIGLDM
jgi:MFS family permease